LPEPDGPQGDDIRRADTEGDIAQPPLVAPASWNDLLRFADGDALGTPWTGDVDRITLVRSAGYAFRRHFDEGGLTTSAIVSGLMPVISRTQTFSPRAKSAASIVAS